MTESLFLDYDKVALDREYDNRGKVPEFADYINRWPELSRQARAELEAQLDVSYGASEAEVLDIFTVANANKAPIQVFYHGGY